MKKIFPYLFLISGLASIQAQQEERFTQYMFNRAGLNPGFAGSDGGLTITAIARNQWMGLSGAPQSQLITFNSILTNNRVGVGGTLLRQSAGLTEKYTTEGTYAYRFPFARGYLGIGIQGSLRYMRINFQQAVATNPIESDNAIPPGFRSKTVPNFGTGLYYDSRQFYFGISAPRLLHVNIDPADDQIAISKEVRHWYMMAGMAFEPIDGIKIQPQLLLKVVQGAPLDADFNLLGSLWDVINLGVSFRMGGSRISGIGESISFMAATKATENLIIGLAYDATLSELRNHTSGTLEAALRFQFKGAGSSSIKDVENGRIFNSY
jgi:type IX secretion system PorP/SprF family membrane protein